MAGLGVSLGWPVEPPILRVEVLVRAPDATRVDALGPLLAAFLLTGHLTVGRLHSMGTVLM